MHLTNYSINKHSEGFDHSQSVDKGSKRYVGGALHAAKGRGTACSEGAGHCHGTQTDYCSCIPIYTVILCLQSTWQCLPTYIRIQRKYRSKRRHRL